MLGLPRAAGTTWHASFACRTEDSPAVQVRLWLPVSTPYQSTTLYVPVAGEPAPVVARLSSAPFAGGAKLALRLMAIDLRHLEVVVAAAMRHFARARPIFSGVSTSSALALELTPGDCLFVAAAGPVDGSDCEAVLEAVLSSRLLADDKADRYGCCWPHRTEPAPGGSLKRAFSIATFEEKGGASVAELCVIASMLNVMMGDSLWSRLGYRLRHETGLAYGPRSHASCSKLDTALHMTCPVPQAWSEGQIQAEIRTSFEASLQAPLEARVSALRRLAALWEKRLLSSPIDFANCSCELLVAGVGGSLVGGWDPRTEVWRTDTLDRVAYRLEEFVVPL